MRPKPGRSVHRTMRMAVHPGDMQVRDGVETDADAVASLAGLPVPAARQLLRDRTVRVVERAEAGDGDTDADGDDGADGDGNVDEWVAASDLAGFVAFSARPGTVHVTQVAGESAAVERLVEEPVRFARSEGMDVEVVLPADAPECGVLESCGFEYVGDGPVFEGGPTRRYRLREA